MNFSLSELIDCLNREVRLRKRLYPSRVANRRMTQKKADKEIAMMEHLLAEYLGRQRQIEPELDL